MTDSIETEGSAARVADRGADQLGYGGPAEFDLNSVVDVAAQYDAFRAGCIALWRKGEESQNVDVVGGVKALSDRYTHVFLGGDPAIKAPAWNSPDQLGAAMLRRMGDVEGETAEQAMDAFWHAQAAGLFEIMNTDQPEAASIYALDVQREEAIEQLLQADTQPTL